jgi:hypothetical protein
MRLKFGRLGDDASSAVAIVDSHDNSVTDLEKKKGQNWKSWNNVSTVVYEITGTYEIAGSSPNLTPKKI